MPNKTHRALPRYKISDFFRSLLGLNTESFGTPHQMNQPKQEILGFLLPGFPDAMRGEFNNVGVRQRLTIMLGAVRIPRIKLLECFVLFQFLFTHIVLLRTNRCGHGLNYWAGRRFPSSLNNSSKSDTSMPLAPRLQSRITLVLAHSARKWSAFWYSFLGEQEVPLHQWFGDLR